MFIFIGISNTATIPEFIRKFQTEYTIREGENLRMEALLVGNPRPSRIRLIYNHIRFLQKSIGYSMIDRCCHRRDFVNYQMLAIHIQ